MLAADLSSAVDVPAGVCAPLADFKTQQSEKFNSFAPSNWAASCGEANVAASEFKGARRFFGGVYWDARPTAGCRELKNDLSAFPADFHSVASGLHKRVDVGGGKGKNRNSARNKIFLPALVR